METEVTEDAFDIRYKLLKEENKEQFFQIVFSNCKEYVRKFLLANKVNIKKSLSNAASKIFEESVIKKNAFSAVYLKNLINMLDEPIQDRFLNYCMAGLFSEDKEIVNFYLKGGNIDKDKVIDYLLKCDESKKEAICNICNFLSIDLNISEDEIKFVKQANVINELEKKLKNANKELETCKSENKKLETDNKNKNKEISEKSKQIDALEKELSTCKKSSVNKTSDVDEKKLEKEQTINDNNSKANDKLNISFDDALDDLESRTLIGVVKAEGIRPDKPWVIISPIIPIINENANINREEMFINSEYRSDYNSFLLFLDNRVLKMVLSEQDANNYEYYSNDEKYSCLFEAFCKKLLFFVPRFNETDNSEKLKLNAYLIQKPVEYKDFTNSSFVPYYDVSKKRFEDMLNKHENLVLENYPYSLSSMLRFVCVGNSIYEINYVPDVISDKGENTTWKYNMAEGKEPFKKLDIKINEEGSNNYIFVPSGIDSKEKDDLYIKNIALIQTSRKVKSIFDEEEFILNIQNNAKAKHLFYNENDLKNFHVAIKSSSLVILAGPSGTGKTKLPLVYANTLGLDIARNTILFVPISPSYLEPEDVLGYVKPLQNNDKGYNAEFIESQTGLVSFLADAQEHKDKIHLVIFDEMNLSQIEHWFAPFISLLEQDQDSRELHLYSNNVSLINGNKFPSTINIGENVFFVGTVNIDETTKHISDRLLDRAIVINLAAPSFADLKNMGTAALEMYPEVSYSRFSNSISHVDNAALEFSEEEFGFINELNNALINSIYGKSISFRSLNKIATYLKNSKGILERKEAFDFAIAQMVIQKISGSNDDLKDLFTNNTNEGILCILDAYPSVSDFDRSKKAILKKVKEIERYGFTR